ncbi:hypothetical protein A5819_003496 [Enterococcus sp. 7E2_DIV0204]|uniref:hypothetical protein n=1 Tax=unclassified Enterococcus TaxID=2608891 RepID=UPI000B73EE06|nr:MULTISPECIES: hypothetical protein [unclassified Enterococcus]OTN83946.1 hypothetical protein A5819_003496 [Enterococcus sp. 7E2_DIV0204]OTP46854.1 hypothetical protein A5884_003732 [Enterococcus sp. 7D2_DIV0200]
MEQMIEVKKTQLESVLTLLERAEYLLPDTDSRVIDYRQEVLNIKELLKSDKV